MSGNLVQTEANNLLAASMGVTGSYTASSTPMKLALDTVVGSATAAGTEVTGGSYARMTVAFGAPASGSISNSAQVNFVSMPAVNGASSVVAAEIYDSVPTRKWFGALAASKQTSAGDTLSFAVGAIVLSLA